MSKKGLIKVRSDQFLLYSSDPSAIRQRLDALKPNAIVVIDEIQKLPILLDEVHSFILSKGKTFVGLEVKSSKKMEKRI